MTTAQSAPIAGRSLSVQPFEAQQTYTQEQDLQFYNYSSPEAFQCTNMVDYDFGRGASKVNKGRGRHRKTTHTSKGRRRHVGMGVTSSRRARVPHVNFVLVFCRGLSEDKH